MEELTKIERDALYLVGYAAMQIRALARSLPDSEAKAKILAIAEGMHNIPSVLASPAEHRQANALVVAGGVAELHIALGHNPVLG